MKYTDVDMQELQNQSPLEVNASENGVSDHGVKRKRKLLADTSSNNTTCVGEDPEVIDLDGEDSPMDNEDIPLPLNGVTTVKKVSLPWQRGAKLSTFDKQPNESGVESTAADCPATEVSIGSKDMSAPAEADEAVSNHAVEGERKRPILTKTDECDLKKSKLDSGAKSRVSIVKAAQKKDNEVKEFPKSFPRDPSEVSLVDLVEDEDELEKGDKRKCPKKSDEPAKVDVKAASNIKRPPVASGQSDSLVSCSEKKAPVSEGASQVGVQNSGAVPLPSVSAEEKRTSLPTILTSGKNGLISPLTAIEVKKVKLCPQLEKQASAMSPLTSPVATPKQSTSAQLVPMSVSTNASTPESTTPEIPTLTSSKALESTKETVKDSEVVLSGAELEKKKGLNPVHSEMRKKVQQLTRSELESFFLELACELIISKSDAGRYRQLYEEMKESSENKAYKIAHLSKQLVDLSSVVHRAINDSKEKRDTIPPKITRAVGLQVGESQVYPTNKTKGREERSFVTPPLANRSTASTSASSTERGPQLKYGRTYTPSKTSPSTSNGLISSTGAKEMPAGGPGPSRSPQRQLKALHPRTSAIAPQLSNLPASGPVPTQSPQDATPKRLGFIDIAEDKIGGTQIGVRRHQAPAVIVSSASSSTVNSSVPGSSASSSQVIAPPVKVLPQPYARAATIPNTTFPASGSGTRVVAAATIPVASGTQITSPRLTYIIPTSSPIAVQPRQLLLQTAAQSQQIRGRSPVTTMSSFTARLPQAMIMRPNTTLVQVPAGNIGSAPGPALIRAVQPTAAQQMLVATKPPPQPQPARILGMTSRPAPAPAPQPPPKHQAPVPAQLQPMAVNSNTLSFPSSSSLRHPAPLPAQPQPTVVNSNLKPIPRRPVLKLSRVLTGIVLSWNMTATTPHEEIASYQIYAYQEGANTPPSPSLWKKVGDVKALPLPMACTLSQFADGHTYHFAVRAVDVHGRFGEFSVPGTIELFG